LATLAAVPELAGILVVTVDPAAAAIAARHGARVLRDGAQQGHTAAVAAAARRLRAADMLALPADVPLVRPDDIRPILTAHRNAADPDGRGFTIVPAQDGRGSNAVLCAPAGAVPLAFGNDSFAPHLAAARARGLKPRVLRLPRIALDIDTPDDLALLRAAPARTRAQALLDRWRLEESVGA